MGKARIEVWDPTHTSKLGETYTLDDQLRLRNLDDMPATGEKLNELGGGGLTVHLTHPIAQHLRAGNWVRLYSGEHHVHTFRIREREATTRAPSPADLTVDIDGEDPLEAWRGSVVDPWLADDDARPVSVDRVFNWASPPLDTDDWSDTVYNLVRPASVEPLEPEAFPNHDRYYRWILSRPSADAHPAGDYLFRVEFDLDEDCPVVHYLAADNDAEIWVQGCLVQRGLAQKPSTDGFTKTHRWAFPHTAGTITVAIKVTNWPGGSINPSGFRYTAAKVTDGKFGDVLFTSASALPWICKDLPSPFPGFTAPQILQMLLDEAQARGELQGWSIVVHGDHEQIEEYSIRVGTDYVDVISDMRAMWIDARAAKDALELHVWPKGQMGATVEVTLDEPSVVRFTEIEDGEFFNKVQGIWSDGVRWAEHAASIAELEEVRSTSLQLGSVTRPQAVDTILAAYLETHAYPVRSLVSELRDLPGKEAGVDYGVGDTVEVLGEPVRCTGITWQVHPLTGDLIPTPEWETAASVRRRERERALERLIAGFDGPAAAPLLSSSPLIVSGVPQTQELTWSWSDDIEEALNEIDPEKPWQLKRVEKPMRVYAVELEIDEGDLPDAWGFTEIQVLRNGVEMSPFYRVALSTTKAYDRSWMSPYHVIMPSDTVTVRCSMAGGHVDGRVTLYLAEPV